VTGAHGQRLGEILAKNLPWSYMIHVVHVLRRLDILLCLGSAKSWRY